MKKYDIAKAKKFITVHKADMASVSLGMQEDWFWTAETIWKNGKYTRKIDKNSQFGGINGSTWATPMMEVVYKNGDRVLIDCYSGESSGHRPTFLL